MIAQRDTDYLPFHQLIERGAQMHANTTSERYEIIPASDLLIDFSYQRPLNETHMRKLAKTWDDTAVGVLLVSRRANGDTYVIDGQHRLEAMKLVNPGATVPCHVYHGLSIGEEARMFHMQTQRKSINPTDRFKARLLAGDNDALDIQRILSKYGLRISSSQGKGHVQAATMMDRLYARRGIGHLDDVIRLASTVWGEDESGIPSAFYLGLSAFLVRYGNAYDEQRFVRVLQQTPRERVIQVARSVGQFVTGNVETLYGRAFLSIYNHHLSRHKLEDWDNTSVTAPVGK